MIEDLMQHQRTKFTTNADLVDQSFRSPFLVDLEEINGAFEIKEHKSEYYETLSLWQHSLPAS